MITLIKDILTQKPDGQEVAVYGWVRTKRETKNLIFIQVNDGSCFASIQLTFDRDKGIDAQTEKELSRITTGASIKAVGALIESPASGQSVEVAAKTIFVYGEASGETYPLQKKRHTFEFLRDIAHLRARTNTFGAVARVRNQMAFAVHNFFQEHGFQYVHTPLITASDCEGAGEMFQVTTLNMQEIVRKALKDKVDPATFAVDYKQDFFEREAYLTVSGQLEIETYATALSRVYTFGPTFRAENSNTTRHLSEFWMIEPEMSFFRLEDNMDLAEKFVVYLLKWALTHCRADLEFFNAQIKPGLIETLEHVVESKFTRITYTDAVKELEKHASEFEFKPFWGCDLQSEHEKYLTEQVFKGPVIVTDYPKEIKAFYMKQNDDGKTVRAMDVLVPGLGEIIGGSEREDNLAALETRMTDLGLDVKNYWWYLDLRRYGTVPHSGFGLGFDRLLLYVTGMANIRDVIPYPRTPKSAEF
ncbi:asparagine--tRNA ligase [Treponema sp. OMZ 855]|uniref:asparagine--tRNA ligase n=1 Tax=Treponema sp. OMZ 855 TaxID=1643512 RepID=UPI0020A41686|nr:asparagine--tRNA ligase [Treponema sp. OMZ 855]UTC50186.1 asparagine--tRNA ligase [Treponema sp. OMZ 855]